MSEILKERKIMDAQGNVTAVERKMNILYLELEMAISMICETEGIELPHELSAHLTENALTRADMNVRINMNTESNTIDVEGNVKLMELSE